MKMTNRVKRLKVRQEAFDNTKAIGSSGTAIHVPDQNGGFLTLHRPGSLKK